MITIIPGSEGNSAAKVRHRHRQHLVYL